MAIKSEAQKKAVASYKAKNYKKISIDWPREFAEQVHAAADANGETLAGYVRQSIEERMRRDGFIPDAGSHDTQDGQ